MFKTFRAEIDAAIARDPAARSRFEVATCYPGFQAVMVYRMSNALWRRRFFWAGRFLSAIGRWLTGIEIHPGATIGKAFFIDHGMGVVIGETAIIGDEVTLYHDVTLGGTSPSEDSDSQRCVKRHPTLEDGVIIGSGAQILGPITVGKNARVGANAVVTKNVAPGTTMVGVAARALNKARVKKEEPTSFVAYGTPTGEGVDPFARTLEGLLNEVQSLRARVNDLEGQQSSKDYNKGVLTADKGDDDGDSDSAPGKC
ncbi:serine O-acetyltransferase EpsC [Rhodovibrionaceae bacterium A322]